MSYINRKIIEVRTRIICGLISKKGEGYVDTIVKMAIAVVIGALLLSVLLIVMGDESTGLLGELAERLRSIFATND